MSDIIRLLPDHIANQIAAGEVVQRPASVIKELIENAIDAGAGKIDVIIKDAGRTLIQIIDNGKGMSFLDARMAFERHATSKISEAADLFALKTKGFRGEALASIAAIAHVSLKTRRESDELGTHICIEGSAITSQEPVQCPVGSNFEVKNLFYNVPARRNFLKSDNVEFRHILDEFERVALAHPETAFKLVHNGKEVHHLLPGFSRKRIVDIFGANYNNKLVPISEHTDIVRVEGFVLKPESARKTRGEQYFFVNNRFFRDTYFNHAVSSAFEQILAAKLHPGYFLFLEVNPAQIDVNVHPTKTEIKFEEDKAIYSILRSSVKLGLGVFNITPTLDFERETEFDLPYSMRNEMPVEPVIQVNKNYNPFASQAVSSSSKSFSPALNKGGFGTELPKEEDPGWNNFWKDEPAPAEIPEMESVEEQQTLDIQDVHPCGPYIMKGAFLIAQINEGLLVVHYRRAQERLIYEELMRGFYVSPLSSQQLLFPLEKKTSRQEKLAWNEHTTTLERIGFSWNWEEETLHLAGIPAILSESTVLACVDKILEQLQMGTLDKGEIAHIVMSQLAFAGSMNTKLNNEDAVISDLLERLFQLPEHQFTPSGKRILNTISNEQLIQLF